MARVQEARKDAERAIKARIRSRLRRVQVERGLSPKPARELGIDLDEISDHLLSDHPPLHRLPDYHIDHIVPLFEFDIRVHEQLRRAFAPQNLRWLTAKGNKAKGAKVRSLDLVRKAAEFAQRPYKRIRPMGRVMREAVSDPTHPQHEQMLKQRVRHVERQKRFNHQLLLSMRMDPACGGSIPIDLEERERILNGDLPRFERMIEQAHNPRSPGDDAHNPLRGSAPDLAITDETFMSHPVGTTGGAGGDLRCPHCRTPYTTRVCPGCGAELHGPGGGSAPSNGAHNPRADISSPPKEDPLRGPRARGDEISEVQAPGEFIDDDGSVRLGGVVQGPPNPWMSLEWGGGLELRRLYDLPDAPSQVYPKPTVRIPAPPKLDPSEEDTFNVHCLARAYRDAVRRIWGDGPHMFRGFVGSPTGWKSWKKLKLAVEKLIQHELSPIVWVTWSLKSGWLAPKGDKNLADGKPPPIQIIFDPEKIDRFRGWCRSDTRPPGPGGIVTRPPAFTELAHLWHKMQQRLIFRNPDPGDDETVQAIIDEFLPEGVYDELLKKSFAQAKDEQEKLNRQAEQNIWVYRM
jgi:hypothetical protein